MVTMAMTSSGLSAGPWIAAAMCVEAGGVGEAVEQAEAEEQEGCGHSAEEEVLERGFRGLRAALVKAARM